MRHRCTMNLDPHRGRCTILLSDMDMVMVLAMFIGGAGAGFINAVAGGGSALTLPLLMVAGLDAGVANGTNRIAVPVFDRWCSSIGF